MFHCRGWRYLKPLLLEKYLSIQLNQSESFPCASQSLPHTQDRNANYSGWMDGYNVAGS